MRLIDTKGETLELTTIGSDAVEWESERKNFGKYIDRISIVSDQYGICDLIVYDGNDGIRQTNMTKDVANCRPG